MFDWRQWLLRRLFGRLRISDDIVRHLSTFQRLGQRFEIEAPTEMLPVGARTVFRAIRTRAAAQIRPDWLWARWIERQLDPTSPSFVPRGHLPFLTNVTHRNWTMVGTLGSAWEAIVDEAGLVMPWFDAWSIDWWVHDGTAWRFPAREASVRQTLERAQPVVETRMQVRGGEAIHRAYAAPGDPETVVCEIENATAAPIRAAFAVRPYNPEGLAVVERIAVRGNEVFVDGRYALALPGPPSRAILSSFAGGDAARLLDRPGRLRAGAAIDDPVGLAHAAFVYDLASGASVRVAAPLGAAERPSRRIEVRAIPARADVHSTWQRALARGMRVRVPDERMQAAIDANRAAMLLFHDGADITPGPFTYHRFWFRDAAYQLLALNRWGFHDEAREVIASFPHRQRADGFFYSQYREWDSNGAAIWAVAEHIRLTRDHAVLRALAPSVYRGARWIARKRDRHATDPAIRGLLPPGISAEHLGPFDHYYWDDFWSLRGLLDAAWLMREAHDEPDAPELEAEAADLRRDVMRSIAIASDRLGAPVIPAGPRRGIDPGMIGSLVAAAPLGLLAPDDPYIEGTLRVLQERFCLGDAFYQSISHTGLGTYLTLQLAFVELERGDPRAWRRVAWMLDVATPTFAWPEAVHPQLGGGCMGDGHHGWAAADFLSIVRDVLVREAPGGELAILTLLPPGWEGRTVSVRDAPTHHGRISWELSWENDRPVLEWERGEPGPMRAPGLDPHWGTTDRAGRAVLAPAGARTG